MKLLEKATLRNSGQPGAIKSASDFSYSASSYAGDHYRIAGDAGGKSWGFQIHGRLIISTSRVPQLS